jgi:hypothetical protein
MNQQCIPHYEQVCPLRKWIVICNHCWEIGNIQRISSDRQMTHSRIQNREEENAETKREERRVDVELSLVIFYLGVQCYILSMNESMSI